MFQCAAGFDTTIGRAIVQEVRNAIRECEMTRSIWRPEYTVPNGPGFALLNYQELIPPNSSKSALTQHQHLPQNA